MILVEDRALLDAFRRGEHAALETVYRAYVDLVAAVARRGFVLDRQGGAHVPGAATDAEQQDIIQETFTRAFAEKARLSYDGLQPYRPWLMRICKNLMIDRVRKAGREISHPEIDLGADDTLPEPELSLDERRLQHATAAFVAQLDEPSATLYRLRYTEGLPQHRVATEMGVGRKKVRLLEADLRDGLYQWLAARDLVEGLS